MVRTPLVRFTLLITLAARPAFAAGEAQDAAARVERPAPPGRRGVRGDDPEARRDFFLRRRTFPGDTLPADGYALAAQAWIRAREAAARAHAARERARLAGGAEAPEALPTGKWSEVGPAPIEGNSAQSGLFFGNVAGRISSVAVHPTDPNILLAGASQGGLWRTADGGQHWQPVGDALPSLNIAAVRFAPSNPLIAYAATGDDDVSAWGMGVVKSTDGGLTWARVDNGSAANGIVDGTVLSKLEVAPDDPNRVVASGYVQYSSSGSASSSAIYRTVDGGATWSKATLPGAVTAGRERSLAIESGCPARLWAVDYLNKKIIRSTDSGATWSNAAASGLPAFTGNTQLSVVHASCAGSATVFVSVVSGSGLAGSSGYPGFYRSTDDGATFSHPGGVAGPSGACLAQCGYDHALIADPSDASRIYLVGRDLWVSSNGGAAWSNASDGFDDSNNYFGGNMHVDMHDVAVRGAGASARVLVACDGGLFAYDVAGGTFSNLNGDLAISEVVDLAVRADRPFRALAGLQDNGSIHWQGQPLWTARISGDGGASGFLRTAAGGSGPLDGAFTTYVYNYSDKSTDGGLTWIGDFGWTSGPEFGNESANFYAPWIATLGHNRVWHGTTSLWYVNFPNGTWTKLANNPAGGGVLGVIAIHDPDAATLGPFYISTGGSFYQSANGTTWNPRSTGLPGRTITDIEFNPANPAEVWVTVSGFSTSTGRVFWSTNGGAAWTNKSGNLPNVPINAILVDPADRTNSWYVATDAGVYGTANASAASPTWSAVGSNLPAAIIADLEIDGGRYLYAGASGRSVWRIALPASCAAPPAITNSVRGAKNGAALALTWGNVSGADGYTVYEDGAANGEFIRIAATALDGASGAGFTPAAGNRFYRVAPSGPCGEGPK